MVSAARRRDDEQCENSNDITEAIIYAAIQRDLGPELLESVYEAVLARALEERGFMWSDKRYFASLPPRRRASA